MGREFLELFEEWSKSYDDTVEGKDKEYEEVFKYYEQILESVSGRVSGHVLEFGTGTGNLTKRLLDAGHIVTGVEPSGPMREKAIEKLPEGTVITDGDFLDFQVPERVDGIVSSWAFHHLTDEEKAEALAKYGAILKTGGKIVFADTMYQSADAYAQAVKDAEAAGYHNLANDLQTEYYTTIPFFQQTLEDLGFRVSFERCNQFVWIMEAEKL